MSERWQPLLKKYLLDEGRTGYLPNLQRRLQELADGGFTARVWIMPPGGSLKAGSGAWNKLKLNPHYDLLLVFNGFQWQAQGWGLTQEEIDQGLRNNETARSISTEDGLIAVLNAFNESRRAKIFFDSTSLSEGAMFHT